MHIYLVEAEHFEVPGMIRRAFTRKADAEAFANETANQILKDACEVADASFEPLPVDATQAQRDNAIDGQIAAIGYECNAYADVIDMELEGRLPLE